MMSDKEIFKDESQDRTTTKKSQLDINAKHGQLNWAIRETSDSTAEKSMVTYRRLASGLDSRFVSEKTYSLLLSQCLLVDEKFTAILPGNNPVSTALITKKETLRSGLKAAAKGIFRIVVDLESDGDLSYVVYGTAFQIDQAFLLTAAHVVEWPIDLLAAKRAGRPWKARIFCFRGKGIIQNTIKGTVSRRLRARILPMPKGYTTYDGLIIPGSNRQPGNDIVLLQLEPLKSVTIPLRPKQILKPGSINIEQDYPVITFIGISSVDHDTDQQKFLIAKGNTIERIDEAITKLCPNRISYVRAIAQKIDTEHRLIARYAANGGSSGSAILNQEGDVVGLHIGSTHEPEEMVWTSRNGSAAILFNVRETKKFIIESVAPLLRSDLRVLWLQAANAPATQPVVLGLGNDENEPRDSRDAQAV